MKFDKETKVFMETYDLDESLFWDCHGSPILSHRGWLKVAKKLGIVDYKLTEIEFNSQLGICVIKCSATLDGITHTDYGESSPKNNTNAYIWAMAIKRAKDRVIREFTNVSGVVYSDADLVKGKDGKMQMADKVDAFERTTDEQVAEAIAEVKNIKNKKVIKDEKSKSKKQ
tara:strand:- start:949 stop:1461 length:513 start_codon:yes stop_codon:yes gene_type:complete